MNEVTLPTVSVKNISHGIYAVATVNPKTDSSDDLIATLRAGVETLYSLTTDRSHGYGQIRISAEKALREAGFEVSMSHFQLLLGELCLVQNLGKEGGKRADGTANTCQYQVIDPVFFDVMVSEQSVMAALRRLQDRKELNGKIQVLTSEVKSLKEVNFHQLAKAEGEATDSGVTLEQLAEAVVEVDELSSEVESLRTQVASLTAELAEKSSPAATAAALMEAMRAKKKMGSVQ